MPPAREGIAITRTKKQIFLRDNLKHVAVCGLLTRAKVYSVFAFQ